MMFEYYLLSLFHNAPLILGVFGCVLIVSVIVAPIITGNLKLGSVFIILLIMDIAIGCLLPSGADYARSLLDRSDISPGVRARAEEIIQLENSGNRCIYRPGGKRSSPVSGASGGDGGDGGRRRERWIMILKGSITSAG